MEGSRQDARAQLEEQGVSEEEVFAAAGINPDAVGTESTFDPLHFLFCVASHMAGGDSLKDAVAACKKHIDDP